MTKRATNSSFPVTRSNANSPWHSPHTSAVLLTVARTHPLVWFQSMIPLFESTAIRPDLKTTTVTPKMVTEGLPRYSSTFETDRLHITLLSVALMRWMVVDANAKIDWLYNIGAGQSFRNARWVEKNKSPLEVLCTCSAVGI